MKKLIDRVGALVERVALLYHTEPVAVRMGLATVMNVVVVSGAISANVSSQVQTVVLAALNVLFLVITRQRVTPTIIADLAQLDAYLNGHKDSRAIATEVADGVHGTKVDIHVHGHDAATPAIRFAADAAIGSQPDDTTK